jgi:hypothetical protein
MRVTIVTEKILLRDEGWYITMSNPKKRNWKVVKV